MRIHERRISRIQKSLSADERVNVILDAVIQHDGELVSDICSSSARKSMMCIEPDVADTLDAIMRAAADFDRAFYRTLLTCERCLRQSSGDALDSGCSINSQACWEVRAVVLGYLAFAKIIGITRTRALGVTMAMSCDPQDVLTCSDATDHDPDLMARIGEVRDVFFGRWRQDVTQ